jgi:glycosyltransferase involved in cell wall biosynthesis
MLSNLSAKKGLSDFLSLVEQAERQNMPVVGVLAGPIACGTDQTALKKVLFCSAGRLQYRGPLYGPAKSSFFDDIDAFLLPTRGESYGLVIVEALAHGVPVIASARGCIGSYLTEPAGHAIPLDTDFVTAALQHVMAWISDGPAYARASRAALRLERVLRRQSDVHFERLRSLIAQQHVLDESDREEDGFADRNRPAMMPETRLPNDG